MREPRAEEGEACGLAENTRVGSMASGRSDGTRWHRLLPETNLRWAGQAVGFCPVDRGYMSAGVKPTLLVGEAVKCLSG